MQQCELSAALDPLATAAAVTAVAQGGYVLSRAANDPGRFDLAVSGVLALLGPPAAAGPSDQADAVRK